MICRIACIMLVKRREKLTGTLFTSTHEPSNTVPDFIVCNGLADLFHGTCIVASYNGAGCRRSLNVLPVSRVQRNGLGLDEKPVVGWELGKRDVIAKFRDALRDVDCCFLRRHCGMYRCGGSCPQECDVTSGGICYYHIYLCLYPRRHIHPCGLVMATYRVIDSRCFNRVRQKRSILGEAHHFPTSCNCKQIITNHAQT